MQSPLFLDDDPEPKDTFEYITDDTDSSLDGYNAFELDHEPMEMHMNQSHASSFKQLQQEAQRLQKWITEYGQPAVEKVEELKAVIKMYEQDKHEQQTKSHVAHRNEITLDASRTSRTLSWIEAKENEMRRYSKWMHEVTQLNDQYLKQNKQLTMRNQQLEHENEDLRAIIVSFENDVNCKASSMDLLGDAMAQAMEIQLTSKIRKQLEDDFELKLRQKDIEWQLKLNKEAERLENTYRDLGTKCSNWNGKLEDTYDEKEEGKIHMRVIKDRDYGIKHKLKQFTVKLHYILLESSLMWAVPLIK